MVNIFFYNNTSQNNSINKVLVDEYQISVVLRGDFNITSPELILVVDAQNFNYNYMKIPQFNKSYFIERVEIISSTRVKVMCSCDVLETYSDIILKSPCVFKRKIDANLWGTPVNINYTGKTEVTIVDSENILPSGVSTIMSVLGVR